MAVAAESEARSMTIGDLQSVFERLLTTGKADVDCTVRVEGPDGAVGELGGIDTNAGDVVLFSTHRPMWRARLSERQKTERVHR